jgi:hypothetical protein
MKLGLEFENFITSPFDLECTYHAEILITLKREFLNIKTSHCFKTLTLLYQGAKFNFIIMAAVPV